MIIIIFLIVNFFHCVQLQTKEDIAYDKAWEYYRDGKYKQAHELIEKWNQNDSEYGYNWNILLGLVYLAEGNEEKALSVIKNNGLERTIKELYENSKNDKEKLWSSEEKEAIKTCYKSILFIAGVANYNLKNYKTALEYLLKYRLLTSENVMDQRHLQEDSDFCCRIAISYYFQGDYGKSLEYFKIAYRQLNEGDKKDIVAYNIAAVYAKQGNIEKSIEWLEKIIKKNPEHLKNEIAGDNDFDQVRESEQFKKFIKKYDQ